MKIFCVGRNYAEHARELDNPLPESPLIFMKPQTAVLEKGKPFFYPDFSKEIHYEAELVVRICKNGKKIAEKFARRYYDQVTIGLDLTARDLQSELKKKGWPWEIAKGFDGAAVIGEMLPFDKMPSDRGINFTLKKNGQLVQKGDTAMMLYSIDHLIHYISQFFTLLRGDLIFTGTPAGVGPLNIGDHFSADLESEMVLNLQIK